MNQDKDYYNFSDTEQMIEDFNQGSDIDEPERLIGTEIQKILKYKNPITSIQHLTAFQMVTLSFQNRQALKILRKIKQLLMFLSIIMSIGVFILIFKS